jgi:hypothetical protein
MKKQHLSTDSAPKTEEEKIDKRLEDSFPTSDPPSHSPGTIGAAKKPAKEKAGGR